MTDPDLEKAREIVPERSEIFYTNQPDLLRKEIVIALRVARKEGYEKGVRECMAISDGEAPNDYPADLISGCKYHVTEKMLGLIDSKIADAIRKKAG